MYFNIHSQLKNFIDNKEAIHIWSKKMNKLQKPNICIQCGKVLHRKSEYFCSKTCAGIYNKIEGRDKIPFLSKRKIRKLKLEKDPWIARRRKTRQKTKLLIKDGRIKPRNCNICGSKKTIIHHEDYGNPFDIVWLCEEHHKAYHQGKIKICSGKLKWDDSKLTNFRIHIPQKKKSNKKRT